MGETKKQLRHDDLMQFTGDVERYRHPLKPYILYTPGVKYVADEGEAHWLIDAIASYFGTVPMEIAMFNDARIQSLQFWRLEVSEDNTAVLTARADSDAEPFVTQDVPFTDFSAALSGRPSNLDRAGAATVCAVVLPAEVSQP